MVQNLYEWPNNVWFNLRTITRKEVPALHCLGDKELETEYSRDPGYNEK